MEWFDTPTPTEFKEKHYDFEKGCWKRTSNKYSYDVLLSTPAEKRYKTHKQIEKEKKAKAKEDEINKKINEKEKWERGKKE